MAITYKKLDFSMPSPEDTSEEDKWKYIQVEKSKSMPAQKEHVTWKQVSSQISAAEANLAELKEILAGIEAKAKP